MITPKIAMEPVRESSYPKLILSCPLDQKIGEHSRQ
jgi:hypothetical protein